jgi:hypothetical protein
MDTNLFVPLDTQWFDSDPQLYLERPDFIYFQNISGVDFRDLLGDETKAETAQEELVNKSLILRLIQNQHFGWPFPFFTYTHDFEIFKRTLDTQVKKHDPEIDKIILGLPMCDSLRRRNEALSHAIIPYTIHKLHRLRHSCSPNNGKVPLVVKNLGSGPGLDVVNAAIHVNGNIGKVINYETDGAAVNLGDAIVKYSEQNDLLKKDVVSFVKRSLVESTETSDLNIKIGVICGMQDPFAQQVLNMDYMQLRPNSALILSSSNKHMESTDPLASFLIQRIGSRDKTGKLHPKKGWGLNYRTPESLHSLLSSVGFSEIEIYDDSSYVNQEWLPKDRLYGVDTIPSLAIGSKHSGKPLSLPPEGEMYKHGYNLIAIAWKN